MKHAHANSQTLTNAIKLGFARLDLEESCDCFFGIAFNDESFLSRPRFTFSTLRLWFFCHLSLLCTRFLFGVKVPQPGIEPGYPDWARGCKPRSFANSDTGGYKSELDAGAGSPVKSSPAPAWFFRPSSAALRLSSCFFLLPSPAQKPVALMKWCIQQAGEIGSIVDPFAGSGSILRAAKDAGLKAIGIEIEEKYCEIAAKRLSQEVFDFGN